MKNTFLVVLMLMAMLEISITHAADCGGLTALYRYWNGRDHLYTTNIAEIGTKIPGVAGHHGYTSEGTQCLLYAKQLPGTVPLYRYWNGIDHLYTIHAAEIGTTTPGHTGNHGYISEGITGYCFLYAAYGTIPLHRYWNGVDHLYTTNMGEIGTTIPGQTGNHNYISEGVACYVISFHG